MLRHILVKDLVIVRALALDLHAGMTVLTGETGAGKSILIDALGLTLGDKADASMLRAGAERAEVSALFDLQALPQVRTWLAEQDLDDGDDCLIRRVIHRSGRSKAYVNGSPLPLQGLRSLGEQLVDIHGQHAHQSLLKRPVQRQLLDAFAGHQPLLDATATAWTALRNTARQLEALRTAAQDRANRLDYLRFQVDELDSLALQDGELESLAAEQRRLAHAEQLASETGALLDLLYDGDAAVHPLLSRATETLSRLARLDDGLQEGHDLLDGAAIQVAEAAALLRSHIDRAEPDPARLADIDARLGTIHDLSRKHRVEPEALGALQQQLLAELAELDSADQTLETLEAQLASLQREYREAAQALSRSRAATASELAERITTSMHGLGMPGGRFAISVTPLPEAQATATGQDEITFMVAANPGQALAPLAKVASGGELSRISLALQVALAGCTAVPTLIFDEVDVGIGGAVAEIVGQLLRRLGGQRQVLCVTHLPQVASQGEHHLQVAKHAAADATETRITPLDDDARVAEVARMLGGVEITPQTLAHAREMLAGPGTRR